MLIIDIAGTRKGLENLKRKERAHFHMSVLGRVKHRGEISFSILCVEVTRGTGLKPGHWVTRLVAVLH